jgi:L,D-transpeptidase ErfK/SrfK
MRDLTTGAVGSLLPRVGGPIPAKETDEDHDEPHPYVDDGRMIDPTPFSGVLRFAVLCTTIVALHGCAVLRDVRTFPDPLPSGIERNRFTVEEDTEVVGRVAAVRIVEGDTLPDIARHFGLGINEITAANPGVDVWVPKAGKRVTLPLSFILPDAPRKGIVVNLAAMRLFQFKGDAGSLVVTTYPVGIGTEERSTPTGEMYVTRKATRPTWRVPASIAADRRKKGEILPKEVPPGPENPLGDYALYLSKSGYLIHGTNKPASIGLRATNGCIRLYPEDVQLLYDDTPAKTPLTVVNQPYLIGERNGVLYMEAHPPLQGAGSTDAELKKVLERLGALEERSRRTLDWKKIKQVQAEARGIPVPISEPLTETEKAAATTLEVQHPVKLLGRPEIPALSADAWYVLAADMHDEIEARRLAAILNHQGPQIPARVTPKSNGYHVLTGPFGDLAGAQNVVKRLKVDLQIEGVLVAPAEGRNPIKGGG